MRIRSGVLNSQWADECGEENYTQSKASFDNFVSYVEDEIARNDQLDKLIPGSFIAADWACTDPDSFEVTEVISSLEPGTQEYFDWLCEKCCVTYGGIFFASLEGCPHCSEGFKAGEDRFIVRHGPLARPYLCLTRYFELMDE